MIEDGGGDLDLDSWEASYLIFRFAAGDRLVWKTVLRQRFQKVQPYFFFKPPKPIFPMVDWNFLIGLQFVKGRGRPGTSRGKLNSLCAKL